MKKTGTLCGLVLLILMGCVSVLSQDKFYTDEEIAKVEKLFEEGNTLAEAKKFPEALAKYEAAIAIIPDSAGLLYNGGLMAFQTQKFEKAEKYWVKLKELDAQDWQVRAKLIQTYQSLGNSERRDAERKELFELRKKGTIAELNDAEFYCREQAVLGGRKVMVFEHFELTGDRALRYVFYILNEDGKPEYRISLGSYSMTNAVWRETTKPKPKPDERLFHLDGYFQSGHSTYGMYAKEPTYDETRKMVEEIIAKNKKPVSATIINKPKEDSDKKDNQKP